MKNTNAQEVQEETHRICEPGYRCIRQNDCPYFLELKRGLNQDQRGSSEYDKALSHMKQFVCNKEMKSVCCKTEVDDNCDSGLACIPANQCKYAGYLEIQYKNGDSAAGLVCNVKERKVCCSSDQGIGEKSGRK